MIYNDSMPTTSDTSEVHVYSVPRFRTNRQARFIATIAFTTSLCNCIGVPNKWYRDESSCKWDRKAWTRVHDAARHSDRDRLDTTSFLLLFSATNQSNQFPTIFFFTLDDHASYMIDPVYCYFIGIYN